MRVALPHTLPHAPGHQAETLPRLIQRQPVGDHPLHGDAPGTDQFDCHGRIQGAVPIGRHQFDFVTPEVIDRHGQIHARLRRGKAGPGWFLAPSLRVHVRGRRREVHDPGIGFVTITRVTVTIDLQIARGETDAGRVSP